MQDPQKSFGLDKVAWIVIAGATVMTIAMGVRSTFGVFLNPLSTEHGVSITMLSFAIALQNLVWGLAQPLAGAISDRHGAGRVIAVGGVLYAAGLIVVALFSDPMMIIFGGGILIGMAQSCTTFAVVLGVVGQNVGEKRRPMALGVAAAGGSFAQMAVVPLAQGLIEIDSVVFSLMGMAALTFILVPLAMPLAGQASDAAAASAFILMFFFAPKTEVAVIAFAIGMGALWLGTVPLTSGIIAKLFGPANLGLLFGVCFFSHQMGSFLGVWIGGYLFDLTGNYDTIWILTGLAGFMVAAFNLPIKERSAAQPA